MLPETKLQRRLRESFQLVELDETEYEIIYDAVRREKRLTRRSAYTEFIHYIDKIAKTMLYNKEDKRLLLKVKTILKDNFEDE